MSHVGVPAAERGHNCQRSGMSQAKSSLPSFAPFATLLWGCFVIVVAAFGLGTRALFAVDAFSPVKGWGPGESELACA